MISSQASTTLYHSTIYVLTRSTYGFLAVHRFDRPKVCRSEGGATMKFQRQFSSPSTNQSEKRLVFF